MPIKFLLLGGVFGVSWKGGWKCQFYFYERGDFSDIKVSKCTFSQLCLIYIPCPSDLVHHDAVPVAWFTMMMPKKE